ncbi:MAG: hypothetical protein VYB37_07310, partial [Pseudomonadota bacterium]|nr:hypothetical protein [Pseudomonadota bacterium]
MATAYQPNDSILTSSSQQRRRLRLGEVWVSEGIATEAYISSALAEQKRRPGKRLGEVLVQLGIVGEVVIGQTLARKIGLRFVDLNALEIQSSAQSEIPKKVIVEYA